MFLYKILGKKSTFYYKSSLIFVKTTSYATENDKKLSMDMQNNVQQEIFPKSGYPELKTRNSEKIRFSVFFHSELESVSVETV